jgi:hypothetical protein
MTLAAEVAQLPRERAALERQIRAAQDRLASTYPALVAKRLELAYRRQRHEEIRRFRALVAAMPSPHAEPVVKEDYVRDPMRGIMTTPAKSVHGRRVV